MIITWYGQFCFRVQSGEVNILIDPPLKSEGIKTPRNGANILILTRSYKNEDIKNKFKDAFVIDGPGEYEFKKTFIQGLGLFNGKSSNQSTTLYKIDMESISICHTGGITEDSLGDKGLDRLGNIDILMIPVGGSPGIEAETASKIINQIEPGIVIPMQFRCPGVNVKLDKIDKFLKIMGLGKEESLPKLVIKKKELPQEETKVVVLKPS